MSTFIIGAVPPSPSAQLQVVIDYLTSLCQGDFDKMGGLLTDGFTHYFHPKSLGYPPADKAAWIGFNSGGFHMFKDFKFNVFEVVEGQSTLTLHASAEAKTAAGDDYTNEYALFFEVARGADGSMKIKRNKEFVDSKYVTNFFQSMGASK
ncbi:hypothetical protein QCA50_014392 [Cerrena zonata]|uniref:DUF4440 domain-containing protein n=1 Tax=Cerrena zonata TaxID=2478898 RepID=A0AAW0FTG7_9APHY